MAEPKSRGAEKEGPAAKRPASSGFSDVTKEVARRNEEAQKEARKRRPARESEQMAVRRRWERL
jgi:hypothetical protein